MFWRLGFGHSSPIETILDSEDFTLQQLLDEDDLIQECKQLNKKLIDFLALPEQVDALLNYVVREVPPESDDKTKFIYPYKASEVLSADLAAVVDCIFQNENLLDKLFDFLQKDPPLNPLLAGYFGKVVTTILARRPEQTLQVLHSKSVVPMLLNHLSASSILELLQKVVSEAEEIVELSPADWIYQIDLVGQLIAKLDPALDSEIHANACTALVGFVAPPAPPPLSWPTTPPSHRSRFAGQLLARETVSSLLDRCLKGSPSTLQHGLTVLVEIVRHCISANRQGPELQPLLSLVLLQLKDLVEILRSPPSMPVIVNTSGTLDPPLGSNRLKILEVIQALLTLKDEAVEAEMIRLQVLPLCLDLFFKYEWHSFLHNLVKNTLHMIIEGGSQALKRSLFTDGALLNRIVDAHKRNDEAVKQPKSCRKGYMGQLRLVSNLVMKQKALDTWMEEFTTQDSWKEFAANQLQRLNDVNERRNTDSGASKAHESQGHSEDEDFHGSGSKEDVLGGGFEFRMPDNAGELFSPDRDDDLDLESGSHYVDVHDERDAPSEANVVDDLSISTSKVSEQDVPSEANAKAVDDLSKSMSKLQVESGASDPEPSAPTQYTERVVVSITLTDGPGSRACVTLTTV